MENTKHYKIEVTQGYGDFVKVYEMDLDTDRLDWSLEQYGRNRGSIKFKVLEIDGVVQTANSSII